MIITRENYKDYNGKDICIIKDKESRELQHHLEKMTHKETGEIKYLNRYTGEELADYFDKGLLIGDDEVFYIMQANDRKFWLSDFYELAGYTEYMDSIEQLPPKRWINSKEINIYCCLEAMSSTMRTAWIKYKGKFYGGMTCDTMNEKELIDYCINQIEKLTGSVNND